jgi:hypothetical protein
MAVAVVVVIVMVGVAVVVVVVVELPVTSEEEINHKSCDSLRVGSNDLLIFFAKHLNNHMTWLISSPLVSVTTGSSALNINHNHNIIYNNRNKLNNRNNNCNTDHSTDHNHGH